MTKTISGIDELLSGRYRLDRLIGQGGMSDVYRGLDTVGGTEVAIKIVRSGDPELARRLAQEATTLKRFTHPGLVRLLDTGVHGDQAFLVMEYVEGPNLASVIRRGPLSPADTAALGAAVAGTLAYVHAQGVVHRDVKPANVLLDTDGRPRLSDFGVARLGDASTLTATGTTLGTASYMAPEQIESNRVGPPADLWSLGMVLFECLTGRRIYEGTPNEVMAQRLAGPVALGSELPVTWRLLLAGLLDQVPERRPDATEAAGLLSAPILAEPLPSPPPERPVVLAETQPLDLTAPLESTLPLLGGLGGRTAILPAAKQPEPAPSSARRTWVALALAAALLSAVLLALWLPGSPRATTHHRVPPAQAAKTARTTSTAPPPTVPTPASALANLTNALTTGLGAGFLTTGERQYLIDRAQAAQSSAQAGNLDQATINLQAAAVAIENGVQDGTITPSEASTLQTDLAALATALGMPGAANPPATSVGDGSGAATRGNGKD